MKLWEFTAPGSGKALAPEGAFDARKVGPTFELPSAVRAGGAIGLVGGDFLGQIGTASLSQLPAQGQADVRQRFTPGQAGCYPIWVMLDPDNQHDEVHKGNNRGWANLVVFPGPGAPAPACPGGGGSQRSGGQPAVQPVGGSVAPNLRLDRPGTSVQRGAPAPAGSTGAPAGRQGAAEAEASLARIVLPVEAVGGHFSNVAVTVCIGETPDRCLFSDYDVIPFIAAGTRELATVEVDVDALQAALAATGARPGERTLTAWAEIVYWPEIESDPDDDAVELRLTVPTAPTATPTPIATSTPTVTPLPTREPSDVGQNPGNRNLTPVTTPTPTPPR